MSDDQTPDQEVLLHGVKGAGIANDGDAAYIDLDDGGVRTVRLGVHHQHLIVIADVCGMLQVNAADARAKAAGGGARREVAVKQAADVRAAVHQERRAAVFEFSHDNGAVSAIALEAPLLDALVDLAQKAKAELAGH